MTGFFRSKKKSSGSSVESTDPYMEMLAMRVKDSDGKILKYIMNQTACPK